MGNDKKLKSNSWYRYYDIAKGIDTQIYIRFISKGIVHAVANNQYLKAPLSSIKYKLFNSLGYDINGYDINGYDSLGFNHEGYNINGVNREGYDRSGNKVDIVSAYEASCYAGTETTNQRFRKKNIF